MKILKYILPYLLWIPLSYALAYAYLYLYMTKGNIVKSYNTWEGVVHNIVIVHVVPITGSFILFVFILIDVLYLRKALKNYTSTILKRLLWLVGIALLTAIVHYFLEKVIDII